MNRLRATLARVTPTHATVAVLAVALVVFSYVGRHQWFIRDDWAFLLTRREIREQVGVADWLFIAQDGHWMSVPLSIYWVIERLFGMDSYWPYLVVNMALHVAAVALVRALCRRAGVHEWTTVIVCSLLLLFGSGWENVVFAVQITYNLSLVAFLAHLLLVQHDGPIGRRDVAGAVLGVIGVASSAFGPFFGAAIFVVLAVQRRWRAALVAAVPQGVVYLWWLMAWGGDEAGDRGDASVTGALKFARLALTSTLNGMTGQVLFAGAALFGIVVVVAATALPRDTRVWVTVLAVLPVPVMLAIGWQRAVFGLDSAASPRYQYMAAMMLAVPFGLAIDQLRRVHRRAIAVGWALAVVSIASNTHLLVEQSDQWADRAAGSRRVFELVAGSDSSAASPGTVMSAFDPDVTVAWLPLLVRERVITPRTPQDEAERDLVRRVLAGTPEP